MMHMMRQREYSHLGNERFQRMLTNSRNRSLSVSLFRDIECKHIGGVISLALDAAECRYLLSGGSDGQLGIYDMNYVTNSMNYTHPAICFVDKRHQDAHKTSISSITWYPHDSGIFLSCSTDKTLKVWDANELLAVEKVTFSGMAYCVDMSPIATTHSLAAVATEKSEVTLVDLKTGSRSHTLKGHRGAVLSLNWSKNDEFIIASGGRDGRVMLWDIRRSKSCILVLDKDKHRTISDRVDSKYRAHEGKVSAVYFTKYGHYLVTMGTDYRIRTWSAFTGRKLSAHFGHHDNQSERCVQICGSDDVIFAPECADIQAYDLNCGDQVLNLQGHYTTANCCVYNENRQELYSGANDRNILIYTADTTAERRYKEYLETLKPVKDSGTVNDGTGAGDNDMLDAWSSDSDSDDEYNPG